MLRALALASVATTDLGSYKFAVHAKFDWVSAAIRRHGWWELSHPNNITQLAGVHEAPLDGVFLDVGANLGYYSFLFAQFGYSVVSVEPSLSNRKAFNATRCMNPELARRIRLVESALGARGSCLLQRDVTNVGNAFMDCTPGVQCNTQKYLCEDVPSTPLNDILRSSPELWKHRSGSKVRVATQASEGLVVQPQPALIALIML